MSLDITIKYKKECFENYGYTHYLEQDKYVNTNETEWSGNITHNLGRMASKVLLEKRITLYDIVWRLDEMNFIHMNTSHVLPYLIKGIKYMLDNRLNLIQYEPENKWGTYNGFMKFLLSYKQACEDHPNCEIEISR